jgi:acyl carrier protein
MSRLTNIFAAVLGIEESGVSPQLSPENTPTWDSLNAIVLVAEIEKAFGIKFSYDEVMAVKNFGDAFSLIRAKGGNPDE